MKYKYPLAILLALAVAIYFGNRFIQKSPTTVATSTPRQIEPDVKTDKVTALFVGDVMLDRTVRTTIEKNGFIYPFEDIKIIFNETDLAVGNLEGAITSNRSISQNNFKILKFTFPATDAKGLKDLGFTGFSLANNHTKDFGSDGYLETLATLGIADLFSFGSPSNDVNLVAKFKKDDSDICFVGYHALYSPSTLVIENKIKELRPDCAFIIVFAHWGEEYQNRENKLQVKQGHAFIDSGADLVIGAHPHVIQPMEIYKDKAIFYSLGNFIFDQDFSLATRQGLAVRMELEKDKVTYRLIGLEMSKNKLFFPEKEAFQSRLDILISKLPENLKKTADIDGMIVISR